MVVCSHEPLQCWVSTPPMLLGIRGPGFWPWGSDGSAIYFSQDFESNFQVVMSHAFAVLVVQRSCWKSWWITLVYPVDGTNYYCESDTKCWSNSFSGEKEWVAFWLWTQTNINCSFIGWDVVHSGACTLAIMALRGLLVCLVLCYSWQQNIQ